MTFLTSKKPGETVKIRYSRAGTTRDVEIVLAKNFRKVITITPVPDPAPLQAAIIRTGCEKRSNLNFFPTRRFCGHAT